MSMTHAEGCALAVKWLKRSESQKGPGCLVALSESLSRLAHALPYVLSGRRHWNELSPPETSERMLTEAHAVVHRYGFDLPDDSVRAVHAMLDLAAMLLNPSASYPVEGWRASHPINAT